MEVERDKLAELVAVLRSQVQESEQHKDHVGEQPARGANPVLNQLLLSTSQVLPGSTAVGVLSLVFLRRCICESCGDDWGQ